jgi:hypothetical protein
MSGAIANFKKLVESGKKTGLFVDKTLLINEIIAHEDPLLITRPRRWGKTLNMSMLFYYFVHRDQLKGMGKTDAYIAECDALFQGLHINTKHYMGQYPVISINFALSDMATLNWDKIKDLIISRITSLFSEFNYLAKDLREQIRAQNEIDRQRREHLFNHEFTRRIQSYKTQFNIEQISSDMQAKIYADTAVSIEPMDTNSESQEQKDLDAFERIHAGNPRNDTEFSNSINFLAQLLYQYHKKPVYILVDEYDNLINKYFDNAVILNQLTQTLSGLFTAFAKPNGSMNDHIQTVIFTGILRIAKANIFSGLNNVADYTVFDNMFSPYYGFTDEEVVELLNKSNRHAALPEVRHWYNGYKIGGTTIYNPWSVIQFIRTGVFDTYWINTARPGMIKDIILNNKGHLINQQLRQVINNGAQKTLNVAANKSVTVEDLTEPESIWSFLIHTGYLTMESHEFNSSGMLTCAVRIPNAEIVHIYKFIVHKWIQGNAALTGAMANLFHQDYEGFADNLHHMLKNKYNSALFSKQTNSVEEVYHSLLLTELNKDTSHAHYALLPEEPTGDGRADIVLIDHHKKIVVPIELKRAYHRKQLEESATAAVKQAMLKQYGQDLQYQDYTHHPAVGVSFFGTDLVLKIAGSDIIVQIPGV